MDGTFINVFPAMKYLLFKIYSNYILNIIKVDVHGLDIDLQSFKELCLHSAAYDLITVVLTCSLNFLFQPWS